MIGGAGFAMMAWTLAQQRTKEDHGQGSRPCSETCDAAANLKMLGDRPTVVL